MKKIFNLALLALSMVIYTTSISEAQKKFTTGTISYKVIDLDGPEQVKMFMDGTTMDNHFSGDLVRTDMNMMGGMMTTKVITNGRTNTGTMLNDIMGKKIAVDMGSLDNNKISPDKFEIIYDKKETKEIAGYKCHKTTVKSEGGTVNLYVTEKISVPSQLSKQYEGLKGFPLQFEMDQNGMKMVLQATEVTHKKIDDSIFVIPDDYEKMTMKEFQESMQSLGGGF